jgi:hypothetical protein
MASPRSTCSILITSAPQSAKRADEAGTKVNADPLQSCGQMSLRFFNIDVNINHIRTTLGRSIRGGAAKTVEAAFHEPLGDEHGRSPSTRGHLKVTRR